MERSRSPLGRYLALLVSLALLLPSTGCLHRLLATMVYVVKGTNVDAEYDGLRGKRVVVICRPPASLEYRYAGADREIAVAVGKLLAKNVKEIDVVKSGEVESWEDEQEWDNLTEMAETLKAQMVVRIDLEDFSLLKGATLYQGKADATVKVFDMEDGGTEAWQKPLGEVLFPVNSAVPAQEKPLLQFRRQFIDMLAEQIARNFYEHDAHFDFASDGLAHH